MNKNYLKKYLSLLICILIIAVFVIRLLNSLFYMELTRLKTAPEIGSVLYQDNDNMAWILATKEAVEKKLWRIHRVDWDGGLEGREHHWSSPIIWGLRAIQAIVQPITEESLLHSIETAVPIFYTLLCILCTLLIFFLAKRVYQTMAAVFVAFFLIVTHGKWEALNIDHHFLIYTLGTAFLLCLIRITQHKNLRDYILAGIFLGIGFWISAINLIPLLLACVIGGVILDLYTRNINTEYNFSHKGLLLLGLIAGSISGVASIIEYFPAAPLRLEINNYFYAIGLITGFSALSAFKCLKYALGYTLCVLTALLGIGFLAIPNIKYGDTISYLMLYISECQPLQAVESLGWIVLALGIIVYMVPKTELKYILFPLVVTTLGTILTFSAVRHFWLFFIPATCVILSGYNFVTDVKLKRTVVFACLFIISLPLIQSEIQRARVGDLFKLDHANTYRNLGIAIYTNNASSIIMSDPSSSPPLAYYSGGKSIASIYWESEENIAKVAKAFSTEDKEEFINLLDHFKTTTIAIPSDVITQQHISIGKKGLVRNSDSIVNKMLEGQIVIGKEIKTEKSALKLYEYKHSR